MFVAGISANSSEVSLVYLVEAKIAIDFNKVNYCIFSLAEE